MSHIQKSKLKSGFTIIEVMIVLAIAGLILAVVLVAIPQLQKNQRNESRKNVLARMSAEVNNYVGNNEGEVPSNGSGQDSFVDGFWDRYISEAPEGTFRQPNGEDYEPAVYNDSDDIDEGTIYYNAGGICEGELPSGEGTSRNFAIAVGLEGGASYCVDNQ